jgi:amidase
VAVNWAGAAADPDDRRWQVVQIGAYVVMSGALILGAVNSEYAVVADVGDRERLREYDYGPGLAGLIELGLQQSGTDYQKIVLRREAFKGMVRVLFEKVDVLAVPAQTFAAPTLAKMATLGENPELITGLLRFSCPFDMTGSPTITLPGGFTQSGGPVAFQFVGRHFDEARLVAAGDAFQRVTDWHRRHPSL